MVKLIKIILYVSLILTSSAALYAEGSSHGEIVLFPAYTGNSVADVIISAAAARISDACAASGRLLPVEENSVQSVFKSAYGKDRHDLYRNTALSLGADAYAVISLYAEGGAFRAVVEFFPLAAEYKDMGFSYSVYASVVENIPLKAAREFALRLKKFPLVLKALVSRGDGLHLVSAGQWHGLKEGTYNSSRGRIRVDNITRYTSVAQCKGLSADSRLVINVYPDNDLFIGMLDGQILENIVGRYGTDEILNKRRGSGQELILATCLVNQGASFCVPGYGSFLSVEYLGIEKAEPDMTAVGLTGIITAAHFLLPSALTGFEINFFPWIRDSDKTVEMQRLQYFLWATLPVVFTASYYSQLSYQYHEKNLLPPLFMEHDTTAALLSVFIPGGGFFYKGYRGAGWGFYAAEMSLAGYAIYMHGSRNGYVPVAAFAALKAADILAAWILSPSYAPFMKEVSGPGSAPEFGAVFLPSSEGGYEFLVSVTERF
jgi:hypothetical protein